MVGNVSFLSSADFFITLFQEHYQSVKGLDPDHYVPDLHVGPNSLQRLTVDENVAASKG